MFMLIRKTKRNSSLGPQVVPKEFQSVQDSICSFSEPISRLVPGISRLINSLLRHQSTGLCTSRLVHSLAGHQSTTLQHQSTALRQYRTISLLLCTISLLLCTRPSPSHLH